MKRVLDVERLSDFRDRYYDHTLVMATGVFDVVHSGHVHFLRTAKSQGDILVVGINSDRSTKILKGDKDHKRPLHGEQRRSTVVSALRSVDFVFIFDHTDATAALKDLQPDVYVVFEESIPEIGEKPEILAAREIGSMVVEVERHGGEEMSTTYFIKQVSANTRTAEE